MIEPKDIRIAGHEKPTCKAETDIKDSQTVLLPGVSSSTGVGPLKPLKPAKP